uniref:PE family protein n=1 Tax=Macrostomum lignano TaxID=282301 RepID=A0A1I8F6V2_9PLAT
MGSPHSAIRVTDRDLPGTGVASISVGQSWRATTCATGSTMAG